MAMKKGQTFYGGGRKAEREKKDDVKTLLK